MPDYTGGYTGAVDTASLLRSRGIEDNLRMQKFAEQAMAQAQAMRQLQARAQAGRVLYDQFGGGAQGAGGLPPPPPTAAPQAPSPGSLSPGGGNPAVMGPQPQAGAPTGAVPPPPGAQPGGAPVGAMPSQQIPPFRSMPSAPVVGGAPAPGQVPPPPAAAPAAPEGPQAHALDLKSIVGNLQRQGVPSDRVMDMLDALAPTMNAQNKMELDFFKAQNAALKAANDAYARIMTAEAAKTRAATGERAEERRTDQGQQNIDIKRERENRLRAAAQSAAGGSGKLKNIEYIYPKGADGRPDETQAPIGVRGTTPTGKIINLDAEGKPTAPGQGGTAKEAKDTKGSGKDNVRTSIVKAGVKNSLDRLNEIDKLGDVSTSSFFGQHGDNPLTRGAYGAAKGLQSKGQQDADAKWSSMIDEAIPVFTGGLRGSDAFRRFLIEQAPGPGDKPETIREKKRLFRQNIEGTSKAFFGKFSTDPSMWAPGVTKEQVESSGAGAAPQQGAMPAGVPAGSTVIGKTPDGKDVYKAPDGKNYTAD